MFIDNFFGAVIKKFIKSLLKIGGVVYWGAGAGAGAKIIHPNLCHREKGKILL